MSTAEMTAEMFRDLSVIAEDDNLMKRAMRYLKKLACERRVDDSLMTKDEFFAMIDRSLEKVKQGKVTRQRPGESVDDLLKRCGYDI